MKRYIKNGKIYSLPIVIKKKGKMIYTNNPIILAENGFTEYVPVIPEKTTEQLIAESNSHYNRICDEKILNGFVFNENEFYLTLENQTNFANMYIAKDHLTYPQTVKTKTGYMSLANVDEVTAFYLAGINFVKTCLEECWANKQKAETEIINNANTSA